MFSRVPNPSPDQQQEVSSPIDGDQLTFEDDSDWWSNAIEEDFFDSPMPFDASDIGLWNGRFPPPPPRPPFLDEDIASDGLTTCDLCTWAWHDRSAYSLDGSIGEAAAELGWAFTLIIVSIISALLGAIIMVIVLRCKSLQHEQKHQEVRMAKIESGRKPEKILKKYRDMDDRLNETIAKYEDGPTFDIEWYLNALASYGARQLPWWSRGNRGNAASGRANITIKQSTDSIRGHHANSGVWTWLSNRRASTSPDQMGASSSPAENHYTHMDDSYSPVGIGDEALYAELDRESIRSGNPSYQNTAYSQCEIDQEIPMVLSSAPSSAYYSDLSMTGPTDRAYEVVGLTHLSSPLPNWETTDSGSNERRPPRLAAINESSTVPSDYV